jgi:hypothetical protein
MGVCLTILKQLISASMYVQNNNNKAIGDVPRDCLPNMNNNHAFFPQHQQSNLSLAPPPTPRPRRIEYDSAGFPVFPPEYQYRPPTRELEKTVPLFRVPPPPLPTPEKQYIPPPRELEKTLPRQNPASQPRQNTAVTNTPSNLAARAAQPQPRPKAAAAAAKKNHTAALKLNPANSKRAPPMCDIDIGVALRLIRNRKPGGLAGFQEVAKEFNRTQTEQRTGAQLKKFYRDRVVQAHKRMAAGKQPLAFDQEFLSVEAEVPLKYSGVILGSRCNNGNPGSPTSSGDEDDGENANYNFFDDYEPPDSQYPPPNDKGDHLASNHLQQHESGNNPLVIEEAPLHQLPTVPLSRPLSISMQQASTTTTTTTVVTVCPSPEQQQSKERSSLKPRVRRALVPLEASDDLQFEVNAENAPPVSISRHTKKKLDQLSPGVPKRQRLDQIMMEYVQCMKQNGAAQLQTNKEQGQQRLAIQTKQLALDEQRLKIHQQDVEMKRVEHTSIVDLLKQDAEIKRAEHIAFMEMAKTMTESMKCMAEAIAKITAEKTTTTNKE